MIIIMLVTLFTSRVILKTLGVEDYGIYNVVGGIITMFASISGSLSTVSQRYITFEIGRGEHGNLSKVFSISLLLHIALAIVIAIIAEPIGIWFICHKLLIPPERLSAALWVYQFSILSMIVMFISVPYNALIVANEKMGVFALISIIDAFLRLTIAYSLMICGEHDKLIIYGLLMLVSQIIIRYCYTIYCNRNFNNCKFSIQTDKTLIKDIGRFASWSIFGNLAFVTYTQGLNLLLGVFFAPIVNAARGIAVQVQSAVNSFVQNFQTAINPQITKSYAAGNISEMITLVFRSSRFSFYLLMIMTIPVMLQAEMLLNFWLEIVPEYTVDFLRIILLTTWINSIANPLNTSVKATGNIKAYESSVGGVMMLILPISYILVRLGYSPTIVFLVHLSIECVAMIFRIWATRRLLHFSLRIYIKEVLLKILVVFIAAMIVPIILQIRMGTDIFSFSIITIVSIMCSCISIILFGLTKGERKLLLSKVRKQ